MNNFGIVLSIINFLAQQALLAGIRGSAVLTLLASLGNMSRVQFPDWGAFHLAKIFASEFWKGKALLTWKKNMQCH